MDDPILPNELLVSILEHLQDHDDDMKSLRQCSYTNHLLRMESQKILFKAIYFYEYDTTHPTPIHGGSPSTWRRFFDLMEILPQAVDYVKVIHISSNSLFMDEAEKYIPIILPRFKNMMEFSILKEDDHTSWHAIPKTVQNTLLELLQFPSLSDVSIHIHSIPHIHFHKFPPSLKSLTLSLVYLDDITLANLTSRSTTQSQPSNDSQDSRIVLKELSVEYLQENSPTLLWLTSPISPFNFNQLSSLTLRLTSENLVDTGYVDMLFQVVSGTVERLTLALNINHMQRRLNPDRPYHVAPPNLTVLSRLRSLTLEVPVRYVGRGDYLSAIPWITRLLETSTLGLKTIRFDFNFYQLAGNHLAEMQWDGIRKILLEDFPERPVIKFRATGLLVTQRAILQASKGIDEMTGGTIIFAYRRYGMVSMSAQVPW